MTPESIKAHKAVMHWFIDNHEKGVWWCYNHLIGKDVGTGKWSLSYDVSWSENITIVQNDEFAPTYNTCIITL